MTSSHEEYHIKDWEDERLNLKKKLLRGIYSFGFENPSEIQKKAIYPFVKKYGKKRKDIVAQAQSGTGKTGAFVVSSLQILNEKVNKPQVMILAPTHELAQQIEEVLVGLGQYLQIRTKLLIGGKSVDQDKKDLEENTPHVVVGTPGRIHDMIRRKFLKVKDLKLIVVDEADEMLSSGFVDQVYRIFQYMPEDIQMGLFSATMPEELETLTAKFLRDPTKILVKSEELTLQGIT